MVIALRSQFRNSSTGVIVTVQGIKKRGRWTYITTEAGEMEEGSFGKVFEPFRGEVRTIGEDPGVSAPTLGAETPSPSIGGRVRQDNGDQIAQALREATTLEEIWSLPLVLGLLDVVKVRANYSHLSPGLVRMNVGNRLRDAIEARKAIAEDTNSGPVQG